MVGADGNGLSQLNSGIDLLWEFKGWAITKAEMEGMNFNYMPLNELDERLDYYTPVIITNNEMLEKDPQTVQKFMNAVKKDMNMQLIIQMLPQKSYTNIFQTMTLLS